MPKRRGGGRGGAKAASKKALGMSLVRNKRKVQRERRAAAKDGTGYNYADQHGAHGKLASVTDASSLEEFVANAVMSQREFVAERGQTTIAMDSSSAPEMAAAASIDPELARQTLRIPRRPTWNESMTGGELNQLENEAFLKWRGQIAMVEQRLATPSMAEMSVTPFEKNVEVWKQLWRVIERSDVVVQIVDARDPLMFRCQDLEAYVGEVNPAKRCLLIVNKADFLSRTLREQWAEYFDTQGVDFLFFSAKAESERLEAEAKALEAYLDAGTLQQHEMMGGDDASTASAASDVSSTGPGTGSGAVGTAQAAPALPSHEAPPAEEEVEPVRTRVMGREELTDWLDATYAHLLEINTAGKMSTRKAALLAAALEAEKEAAAAAAAKAEAEAVAAAEEEAASARRAVAGEAPVADGVFSSDAGGAVGEPVTGEDATGVTEGEEEDEDADVALLQAQLPLGAEAATLPGAILGGSARGRRKFGARGGQGKAARGLYAGGAIDIGEEHVTWVDGVPTVDMARAAKTIAEALTGTAAATLAKMVGGDAGEDVEALPQRRKLTLGMVGYPNVGKSSLINVLLGVTSSNHQGLRVAVSSTPGKTRHFQTLELTERITLCDCPGLVFPSFVATRAEMVCNGMLPLAHLRDHVPPMWLLVSRIPRDLLNDMYGIKIPAPGPEDDPHRIPTVKEVLDAFCTERGLMAASHAGPNHPAGARILLKDYVSGRLAFCHLPPGVRRAGGAMALEDAAAAATATRVAGTTDHDVMTAVRQGGLPSGPAGPVAGPGGLSALHMTMPKARVGTEATGSLPMQASAGAALNVLRGAGDPAGGEEAPGAFDDMFFGEGEEGAPTAAAPGPVAAPPKRAPRIKGGGKQTRRRKGGREADPYGTQIEGQEAAAAFMDSLVQSDVAAAKSSKASRRAAKESKAASRGAQPAGTR